MRIFAEREKRPEFRLFRFPAAHVLQMRAYYWLNIVVLTATEREEKLKQHNLYFDSNNLLLRGSAILGPVLAGPVGDLLASFAS